MSLRNNWMRYVAVGNVFSELYYFRDELAFADPVHVRRAVNPEDGASYSSARGRSVLASEHMAAARRRRLRRRLRNLLPGELDDEDVGMLEVVGEGMANLAEARARKRITFEDLEEQIAKDSVETWAAIRASRGRSRRDGDASRDGGGGEGGARDCAPRRPRTALRARGGANQRDERGGDVDAGIGDARQHGDDGFVLLLLARGTQATAARQGKRRGRFLPRRTGGKRHARRVARDRVDVQGARRGRVPRRVATGDATEAARGGKPPVTLRGVATVEDANSFPRRAIAAELARKEMVSKVRQAVGHVMKGIVTPSPERRVATKPAAPAAGREPALFRAGNRERRPRVYYHEEAFAALWNIRARAREASDLLPPTVSEEEKEEETAGNAEAENGEDPDPRRVRRRRLLRGRPAPTAVGGLGRIHRGRGGGDRRLGGAAGRQPGLGDAPGGGGDFGGEGGIFVGSGRIFSTRAPVRDAGDVPRGPRDGDASDGASGVARGPSRGWHGGGAFRRVGGCGARDRRAFANTNRGLNPRRPNPRRTPRTTTRRRPANRTQTDLRPRNHPGRLCIVVNSRTRWRGCSGRRWTRSRLA